MFHDQHRAPLFEALRDYVQKVKAPLHMPGHKMGHGAPAEWLQFLGDRALSIDLTEAPGLDDLHAPTGVIAEAQQLAAEAFGGRKAHFLVGGTTAGIHALILTACVPGDTIAVPRHAHRSFLGAIILAGVKPAWVRVKFHEELDVPLKVDTKSLELALKGASAAVLINPTYHGMAGSIANEIEVVHRFGVPTIVDEAHAAHFSFHPAMPASALKLGADAVVQSIHKTGGSLTQSSICLLGQGQRLSDRRLSEMLRLVQSTSPSYLLMASLDVARRNLALNGRQMWDKALELAETARRQLSALPGIRLLDTADPTKVIIDVRGRGLTGGQAADFLWGRGVAVEMAGHGYMLAMLSPGDDQTTVQHLVAGVACLPMGPGVPPTLPEPPQPEVVLSPREAFLGRKVAVPLSEAVGCVAAEMVAPYPPGIPVICPGERLTAEVVAFLKHVSQIGGHIQGPVDPQLSTIQVVRE